MGPSCHSSQAGGTLRALVQPVYLCRKAIFAQVPRHRTFARLFFDGSKAGTGRRPRAGGVTRDTEVAPLLSKWPIRNKLLIGLALLLVIVTTLSASGFIGLYAYRHTVKSLGWRVNELPHATELDRRVGDLRMSLAALSALYEFPDVAGETPPISIQILRQDFRHNLAAVRTALKNYRRELDSNQQHNVGLGNAKREQQTVRQIEQCLAAIESTIDDADWMLGKLKVGQLSQQLAHLQQLTSQLPVYWHRNVVEFTEQVRLQYRTLIVLTWITSFSAIALLALFVHLAYRWVFRPLRVLIKGSRKVASGRFDHRICLDSGDEMAELADAMNAMTARFQAIRDDLDRQVRERTRQVIRSEQLASVGFLAAGVAHEINNPLAAIAMCAESLDGRLAEQIESGSEDCEVFRDYLRTIQTEAFRCKQITSKLLDFSRMGEARRQRTELGEIVQSVIDMLRHLGKYRGKQIRFEPRGPVFASVNPQEIKQVVLNLLANALDSVDAEGLVEVELYEQEDHVVLVVTDNGCGMTDEVLEHLFEPFFTRRASGQGTGLGLSISYRIIADHGGQIDAQSDGPGRGSRFLVRLPVLAVEDDKENENRYQEQAA